MDYLRQKRVADAMLAFGTAQATFHPYWRQRQIVAPDGVRVSYYERGKTRLVIASNLSSECQTRALKLPGVHFRECEDALGDPAPKFTSGSVTLEIPPKSFRIFSVSN